MAVKIGKMEGAGPYYGIPLDELHMEWTSEEELEIERYCEKILKNISEEEMTPMERLHATFEGKERDRLLVELAWFPLYAIRTIDSCANAVKPIDAYRYPKLLVKSHLATLARFKADVLRLDAINYAENMFGWDAKLIEYGNPVTVGEPPIKSLADLEGLEVPDIKKYGLYPQYLWIGMEFRRILSKYGLDKLMPLEMSICSESIMTAMVSMLGMTQFLMAVRKDPQLCKAAMALSTEWTINYGKTVIELCQPNHLFCCGFVGIVPVKGNEWMVEEHRKIHKALAPLGVPAWWGWALQGCIDWLPLQWERETVSPSGGGFVGIGPSAEADYKPCMDWGKEHDVLIYTAPADKVVLSGPVSLIEEEIKERCEYGRSLRKLAFGIGSLDYWTPHAYVDASIEAVKKYGKF